MDDTVGILRDMVAAHAAARRLHRLELILALAAILGLAVWILARSL